MKRLKLNPFIGWNILSLVQCLHNLKLLIRTARIYQIPSAPPLSFLFISARPVSFEGIVPHLRLSPIEIGLNEIICYTDTISTWDLDWLAFNIAI
jgi:hypothetical protein